MADPKRQRHKQGGCVWAPLHRAQPVPELLPSLFPSSTAASTELPRWRTAESWWPARWSTIPSAVPMVSLMPASAHCVPTTCKYSSFCHGIRSGGGWICECWAMCKGSLWNPVLDGPSPSTPVFLLALVSVWHGCSIPEPHKGRCINRGDRYSKRPMPDP